MCENQELLKRASEGEVDSFEDIYMKCRKSAYIEALNVLGRHDLAEEVVQNVFIELMQNWSKYDPKKSNIVSYVKQMATGDAKNLLRREMKYISDIADVAKEETMSKKMIESEIVNQCLGHISEKRRDLIVKHYAHGYSQQELSNETNLPLNTVKSEIARARKLLEQKLKSIWKVIG